MEQDEILTILPCRISRLVRAGISDWNKLQEIRIRLGQKIVLRYAGKVQMLSGEYSAVSMEECKEFLAKISRYSLYAFEEEIRKGYLTIPGGHRIGIVGRAVFEQDEIKTLRYITNFNIRVSHEKIGCAETVMPYVMEKNVFLSTIIISPPGGGKTTLLRDMIRYLSREKNVAVVDERSEIAGCYQGVPQHKLGIGCDVLDACPKQIGIEMVLRSMGPDVIAVDEIGTKRDYERLEEVLYRGCAILATRHGKDYFEERDFSLFQRCILLGGGGKPGQVLRIYNERGQIIWK